MNIKKTKPTPKSIIHKKPTKISTSESNNKLPKPNKYKPPKIHAEKILLVLLKNTNVKINKTCKRQISVNIIHTK